MRRAAPRSSGATAANLLGTSERLALTRASLASEAELQPVHEGVEVLAHLLAIGVLAVDVNDQVVEHPAQVPIEIPIRTERDDALLAPEHTVGGERIAGKRVEIVAAVTRLD